MYAIRVITLPTELDSDFHVDVDEDLIRELVNKNWPNCINIHEILKETGHIDRLWIRMDWGSSSLRTLLNTGWRFTGALWLDVMRGIANGVSYLHANRIFHGDLKPSNSTSLLLAFLSLVFVRIDHEPCTLSWDQIYISELGVRHWFAEYNREKRQIIKIPGTRAYVAPETLKNGGDESISGASDIWSIGCIGAELVTNRKLFESPEMLEAFIEDGDVDENQMELLRRAPEVIHILGGCMKSDRDLWVNIFDLRAELEREREKFPP